MSARPTLDGPSADPKLILVTGATGQQGGALARVLLRRGHRVRALTRKMESPAAAALKRAGAEVVQGDFHKPESVEHAARGVDVAFIVATPYEEGPPAETRLGTAAVDAVTAAGVPYLVYSSVSDADRKTGIPHFDSKATIESHLKHLGAKHSVIAPVFYMENLFAPWVSAGYSHGVLAMGLDPSRGLQVISLPEIAEFTTLAVERPASFQGKRFNIASDELTAVEMAKVVSEASGAQLTYHAVPLDEVRKQSADFARMYDWFNRVGYSADIPRLKREYPEVHWTSFRAWTKSQDWTKILPKGAHA